MANTTQLEIVWDGPLESLSQHRVSLSAFAEPMNLLLAAARRIASNMVSDALEPADTGRLAKEAHQVDIELCAIIGNSGGIATAMTFTPPAKYIDRQEPLFNFLTENVGIALLEAIELESKGAIKHSGVRRYLHALPTSLTKQIYNLHENGRPIKRIEIGPMALPDAQPELPYLCEIVGRIVGVGFEPGRPEVRIKSGETQVTIPASAKQVERALEYRTAEVRATWLKHGLKTKLLSLSDISLPRFRPDPEVYIFRRWGNLLTRLAQ